MLAPLTTALRRGVVAAVLALTMLIGIMASPQAAQASAIGCARWGAVHIPGVAVVLPAGNYCFGVNGSGETVRSTSGSYYFYGSVFYPVIYNYREAVRFYDSRGQNYWTYWGPVHYGWAYGNQAWSTPVRGTARAGGRACGTLLSGGQKVVEACVKIQ